jgi:tetratricopeptide (TPR) repeat protein
MKHPSTRWACCALLLLAGGCSSSPEFLQSAAQTAHSARSYDRLFLAARRRDMNELVSAAKDFSRHADTAKSAQILNAIGYTLADQGETSEQFEAAESLTRRAVELANENVRQAMQENVKLRIDEERNNRAMIRDSLAWALFRLRRYEEALEQQNAAVKEAREVSREPRMKAELYFHLGEILRALGRENEARRAYRDALRDDPDYQPAKTALAAKSAMLVLTSRFLRS